MNSSKTNANNTHMNIETPKTQFGKNTEQFKNERKILATSAEEYTKEYEREILEGTVKRAKLLSEGHRQGKKEEEVLREHGKFIPTIHTPIMNFLYFTFRENEKLDAAKYAARDKINKTLIEMRQLDQGTTDLSFDQIIGLLEKDMQEISKLTHSSEIRETINKKMAEEEERETEKSKESPELAEILYGDVTLDMFNKIKKLKALSMSSNPQEAEQARKKAIEFCKAHNLDFDKIPCYVKGHVI